MRTRPCRSGVAEHMLLQTTWKNNSNALDRAQLVAAGLRQKVTIQPIFTSPAGTRHGHASSGAGKTSGKLRPACTGRVLLVQKINCRNMAATNTLQSRRNRSMTNSACVQHCIQTRIASIDLTENGQHDRQRRPLSQRAYVGKIGQAMSSHEWRLSTAIGREGTTQKHHKFSYAVHASGICGVFDTAYREVTSSCFTRCRRRPLYQHAKRRRQSINAQVQIMMTTVLEESAAVSSLAERSSECNPSLEVTVGSLIELKCASMPISANFSSNVAAA